MPYKKRKGMVLVSFVTITFLFLNFVSIHSSFKEKNFEESFEKTFSTKNIFSERPYCGDLFCNYYGGENPLNCPEDCSLE